MMTKQWKGATGNGIIDTPTVRTITDLGARLRTSRIYLQSLLTLALIVVTAMVARFPGGIGTPLHEALHRTVTYDYDYRAGAANMRGWVTAQGALTLTPIKVWQRGVSQVQHWTGPLVRRFTALMPKRTADAPAAGPTYRLPVKGALQRGFGLGPNGKGTALHEGIDLAAPFGTSVTAAADGEVKRAGVDPKIGGYLEVEGVKAVFVYGQVESLQVKVGDQVRQGELLAVVGRPTGSERAAAAHLHLEMRTPGTKVAVDPGPYFGLGGRAR